MIVRESSREDWEEWKSIWTTYKDRLRPNRKTGQELLSYLQSQYVLTELFDVQALDVIRFNVTENKYLAEKLPRGAVPVPRAFYLENKGRGEVFYLPANRDSAELWGGDVTRIFVGLDLASGYFQVEGSTMLWDELCCFQGLDEKDLQNVVIVAQYILALRRLGRENEIPAAR